MSRYTAEDGSYLVVDDMTSQDVRITWWFPEEEDFGESLGAWAMQGKKLEDATTRADRDIILASQVVLRELPKVAIEHGHAGYFLFTSVRQATRVLNVIQRELQADVALQTAAAAGQPLEAWQAQALAAGWTPPKGWKAPTTTRPKRSARTR